MLEMVSKKKLDLIELLSDNLIVHLPRVEGAERPAKGQAAVFEGSLLLRIKSLLL
jgi:hypothetical protein